MLWTHVIRSVRPLRPTAESTFTAVAAEDTPAPEPTGNAPLVPRSSARPALPPLVPLERTVRRQISRGQRNVDAVLDLHGFRQGEAHGALLRFIHRAQGDGAALVLVVTGKGGAGEGSFASSERGVLRRLVPHWLSEPSLRPCVTGWEEAPRTKGGSGALLVRIRRARPGPG